MKTTFSADLILRKIDLKSALRVFDYLPGVMFFAKDLEGRFIMANQAFAARFGFKNSQEILGKNDTHTCSSPELISHYIKKDREVIESGKPQPGIIELFPNENGEHIWYETTKIPLWDNEGKVCGVCGIIKSYEGTKASIEPYLQVERAAECIRQNLTSRLEISKISKLTGLSIRQFERKFRKAYQVSPRAYLIRMRVAAASDLLRTTNLRPSEISEKTGFYDASDFSRKFKAAMKLSPSEYREQHRAGNQAQG